VNPTKHDIDYGVREQVCTLLNDLLAQAIDLQLQSKQAHWNVKGPNFIALHKLFDDISENVTEAIDLIAERVVQLGGVAEGTVQVVHEKSGLPAYPTDISGAPNHLDALSSAMAQVGASVRDGIDHCAELGDQDAADILTEISRGLDKYLWFVEAHLQN
jgi:starvation-inducible DNA-binding protein